MSLLDFSDLPNKDYTEKKYVPKILLIFPLPNIGASQKKNMSLKLRSHKWANFFRLQKIFDFRSDSVVKSGA